MTYVENNSNANFLVRIVSILVARFKFSKDQLIMGRGVASLSAAMRHLIEYRPSK